MLRIMLAALAASAGMAAAETPPAPPNDYAKPETWLCRPDKAADPCREDAAVTVIAADGSRTAQRLRPDHNAPVDCYYVYPTISRDPGVLSDMAPGPEEAGVAAVQAAPFAGLCRVYAPLYRQFTIAGMRLVPDVADRPPQSYEDVLAAWRRYLAHDNGGRGIVLIGHSQGARHVLRLLREEIDGKPVQARLVSALVIGAALPVVQGSDRGALSHIPLCRSADQTACVISFATFQDIVPPSPDSRFGRTEGADAGMVAACVNPAMLAGGDGKLRPWLSNGARYASPRADFVWAKGAPAPDTPFVALPGWLTARCVTVNGARILEVRLIGAPGDVRSDRIPGHLPRTDGSPDPSWGLHMVDMSLTLGDLLDVVRRQRDVWLGRPTS
jgi:pimeloyl-ACP methyl ester carboxylesterase